MRFMADAWPAHGESYDEITVGQSVETVVNTSKMRVEECQATAATVLYLKLKEKTNLA